MEKYDVVIEPKTGWFDIDLEGLWKYRDLILLFVKRNFIAQYKQTILGPAWAIIQPMLTTVIFTVVFGSMAGLSADGVPSFLFYMSGTIAWTYFSTCLTRGEVHPSIYILLLPLLVVQMAMLALGSGIIISALTTKYRDLKMLISFGVQLWMYGTPVAYDIRIVPQKLLGMYMLNPMTPIINSFRKAFLGIGVFQPRYYLCGWGVTLVILFIGVILFNQVEKTFMDTV